MKNVIVLLSLFLVQTTSWAAPQNLIASCQTDKSAANKYEIYQVYNQNIYQYFIRANDGKSLNLIGPNRQVTFSSDKSQMMMDFGAMAIGIKKGMNEKGVVRALLVPEEQIVCNSDWQ